MTTVSRARRLGLAAMMVLATAAAGCTPAPPIDYPAVGATDPYVAPIYSTSQITAHLGVVYGRGERIAGGTQDLLADVYVPPSTGDRRPVAIYVHGGSFSAGSRVSFRDEAMAAAQRGWVGVTIDYRLGNTSGPATPDIPAVLDAIGDGQLAVQFLRGNAATYDIDVNRVAMLGSSAGGAIALAAATHLDLTEGRWPGTESYIPDAAVSTGASLTLGIDAGLLDVSMPAAPIRIFHYAQDSVTGADQFYAERTCHLWRDAGVHCDASYDPGTGHVIDIGPDGPHTYPELVEFLYWALNLRLAPTP